MTTQVVKVRRVSLASCFTCPLCKKLLREATTISECLHTFCRRCIYEKITDEEVDSCPICNIDLGSLSVEKLRPDHNIQDMRNKIFPLKKRNVRAEEAMPSITLPVRRKERSLSSLVINSPHVVTQIGLTGRRTKSVTRRAATLRGHPFSIGELIKGKTTNTQGRQYSSHGTTNETPRRQNASNGETSKLASNTNAKNESEQLAKGGLWKPLNCLLEVATRPKAFKLSFENSSVKTDQPDDTEAGHIEHKTKLKEHTDKSTPQDDKKGTVAHSGLGDSKRFHGITRKRAREASSAQTLLSVAHLKHEGDCPVWFSLVASDNQENNALPQISACYLRIKDGNIPVSFIMKYLVKKLDLKNESEVQVTCCGQPVVPTLALHNLVDLWMQKSSTSKKVAAASGSSAKDLVMVLVYSRKPSEP